MFFQNFNFSPKFLLFFKILYFFLNRKIFLIFLHIFNIFYMQKNLFKKLILFSIILVFLVPYGFCQLNLSVCQSASLPVCRFVRKSFRHNLLKGGIWPADHDGTLRIASKRTVRPLQALFTQNYDLTKHHKNRIAGPPGHGQSNATHFWSHRRVAREFSTDN